MISAMKPAISFLLVFLFASILVSAQVLKGKITNASGEPVPYATIYIQELSQGTTANTRGDYELKLPAGKYLVTYQSMGYAPQYFNLTVTSQDILKNVILTMQYYQIPEVRISATNEDPAYGIMRKVIGMAPYYLNCINYYKSEVYLKGNLIIVKIPKLIRRAIVKAQKEDGDEKMDFREGDVYLMESYNEVEFTAPDKYVKKVLSFNSTFPDTKESVSPMDFINASFYSPKVADIAISPLSPQAFSYYKFKYLGATLQGNNTVNKIQVIPKINSQQLVEGIIYIIEDLWCIHSLDLSINNILGKIEMQQLYIPVKNEIWMPVTYKFKIDFSMLGIKADVGYGSSIKYLDVVLNASLHKPETVTANHYSANKAPERTETPVSKNQKKIQEILDKGEMKNADMLKVAKLMEKESKKTLPDSVRNNLEIKNNTTNTVEKDAGKKDSVYWAEIRPIPLTEPEMRSIIRRDSIKKETSLKVVKNDTLPKPGMKKKSKFSQMAGNIAFGHTWNDTTGLRFNFGGLLNLKSLSFNTVDGFTYGTDLRISKWWKNRTALTVAPEARWAFSLEKLMWKMNGTYSFNFMKQRQLFFRSGNTSLDISDGGSINPFLNSITTLFFKDNYLKLYQSAFLTTGFRTEIVNGLRLEISAGYENRKVLSNTTDFTIIKRSKAYTANVPDNEFLVTGSNPINALKDQKHFEIVTNVTFTPRQKYSIYKKVKVNRGSDWPTFSLTWKHGINEFSELTDRYKDYDLIRVDVARGHDMGLTGHLTWRISSGGFLNNRYLTWYDFVHFNAQPLPVLIDNYQDAFRLPAYYSLATPEFFGEGHVKYSTPYLLLKYIPGFSKTLAKENLSLSWLGSRYHSHYTEIGYSITQLFFVGELGVYVGFDNLKYRSTGVRFVFKIGN
jgi:hypothetical protein